MDLSQKRSFASNCFIFLKILFQFKSWSGVQMTQMPIFLLFVGAGVLLDGAFSLRVSLRDVVLYAFPYDKIQYVK